MEEPCYQMIETGGEQNHFIRYNCSLGPKRCDSQPSNFKCREEEEMEN
jgi:hypothetical protein